MARITDPPVPSGTYVPIADLPIVGTADCNSTTTLTGSVLDVPGTTLTFTPLAAGTLIVVGTFDLSSNTANDILAGILSVDGSARTEDVLYSQSGTAGRETVTRQWIITGLAASLHTIKLQVQRLTGTGATHQVNATHTTISYIFHPGT